MHLGRMAESGRGLDSSCPKWSKANAFHNHQYLSVRREATSRDALDLVWLLETSRNLINGHSPISLLHLSFNSYLEVIFSGRQHKRRDHLKTQKEPNQVISNSERTKSSHQQLLPSSLWQRLSVLGGPQWGVRAAKLRFRWLQYNTLKCK